MNSILKLAYKELETAMDCLDLMDRVEKRHSTSLLSMSMDSVNVAMDLMLRETKVNDASAPKLSVDYPLEDAESGQSSEHIKEDLGFPSKNAHVTIPVKMESPILCSNSVHTLQEESVKGLDGWNLHDTPLDAATLEVVDLNLLPSPSPKPLLKTLAIYAPLGIDVNDDACSIDPKSTLEVSTRNPLNYTKTLEDLGHPDYVVLKMSRRGGNKEILLPCKYKEGAVHSNYTEASGKVFQGDLKRVAGRVKFLHGYAAKRSILPKCQEEKVSSVDMKTELYIYDPEVGLVPLGDA
jgi:hypothetical protein